MSKLILGINKDIPNREYHADTEYLSSSNLKLILKNPEQFYQERILGNKPAEIEKESFTEGSYTHSLILEPSKVSEEYALFPGWRKFGAAYETFKSENKLKTIISTPQAHRCQKYFEAYMNNPTAQNLLRGGFPEYTMCTKLLDVPVKARADYINLDKGYIVDVKTTAYESDHEIFKRTLEEFKYDLSAALYLQIAEILLGKQLSFYFIVISKSDFQCHVYKLSGATRLQGTVDVSKALKKYKKCLQTNNWTDTIATGAETSPSYEILEV